MGQSTVLSNLDTRMQAVAVLALPPIKNSVNAVRAYIASTARGNHAEG